jgi:hypothetical protein
MALRRGGIGRTFGFRFGHDPQGPPEVVDEKRVIGRQGDASGDHDHVSRHVGMDPAGVKRGGAQAALDPVALDGVADPLRYREADPQTGPVPIPHPPLHGHPLGMETAAAGRREENRSGGQPLDRVGAWPAHRRRFKPTNASGRAPGGRR